MDVRRLFKLIWIPILITLLGTILNLIVIQANTGMPAKTGYAVYNKATCDILNLPYPKHTMLYEGTKFPFLADILPFDFSVGDILIIVGMIACAVISVVYLARQS